MGRKQNIQGKLHLLKQHSLYLRRKTYLQRELHLFEQYIVHYRRYDTRSDTADDIVGARGWMPIHLTSTRVCYAVGYHLQYYYLLFDSVKTPLNLKSADLLRITRA